MSIAGMNKGQNYAFHTLGESTFEDLCRDLLEAEPTVTGCERYGVRGQRQYGIDLIAYRRRQDGLEVGQCKCYEAFAPTNIAKASEAFFECWSHWAGKNVNLSQIFGELLMLIEADKRGKTFAVPLMYRRPNEAAFYVPPNLFIIGMMNLADRSLAIVDYALRRRFAFLSLTPRYESPLFREWLVDHGMGAALADQIMDRMAALNREIAGDPLLGPNYGVGHSFFCPKGTDFSGLDETWYREIVETEVAPLLSEYWFDRREQVQKAREILGV